MSAEEARRLVLELLGEGGSQVELPRSGVLTIGSAASKVGFAVSGQGVSEVHCAIGKAKGGGFALKDLGSEYGTFVNGERVQQAKLNAGDVILVGSRRLRVVDPSVPVTQAPAPAAKTPPAAPIAGPSASAPAQAALVPEPPASSGPKPAVGATNYERTPLPKIPGYRIEKLLGRGGMGEVFLATQERLDRKVALKLLSAKLCADADFVRRFQSEARAAAALTHPNVVVVHDVGEQDGRHYLSMEYMDHGNLEDRVARGTRMDWREVLRVLHDIASALVYAEARGIVHRDIKPANMMLGAAGATKLADLGLATQIEAEARESENGRIFGTPHFISPEQARGERVDGRADLYSLGATAYRLLSGRTPFEGTTTRDILRGHFFETPKSLTELDPQIPPELVRIVERLLQKKPDDRYASAAVLLAEVDRVRAALLHGEGAAKSPAAGSRLALVAVLVLLLGGAAWWFTRPKEEPTPPRTGEQATVDPNASLPGAIATPEDPPIPPKPPTDTDDDTQIQLFEANAKLAWRDVPTDLPPAERAARLKQLAIDYAGTGAAIEMQAEAEQIEAGLQRVSAATAELGARRKSALEALEAAALLHPASAARGFAALNATAVDADLGQDPEFQKARLELHQRVLRSGVKSAEGAVQAIDASAARGDFDDVTRRIELLLADLQAPEVPAGIDAVQLPELAQLAQLAGDLEQRRAGLATEKARFSVAQVERDSKRLAEALGPGSGLEDELGALDFAALGARLSQLESSLTTEPPRALVQALARELSLGHAALRALGGEFASGGWKRKTVADPRGGRSTMRNALAADDAGVTLEVEGRSELVPWSAFGGRPRELHLLFHERLARPYTTDELLGIEALVRTAAVRAAVAAVSEMFDPAAGARFDESEVRQLNELFEFCRTWSGLSGTSGRCERESKAAGLLGQGLYDSSQGSWSAAVAGLDRLLQEFGDTLLVRALSNGSGLAGTPPKGAGGH